MQRSIATYTQDKLEKLWSELAGLPAKLQANQDAIRQSAEMLESLKGSRDNLVKNEIQHLKEKSTAIKARINVLTMPDKISELTAEIQTHIDVLNELQPQRQSVIESLSPIDAQITKLEAAIELCIAEETIHDKRGMLEEESQAVISLRDVIERLETHKEDEISKKRLIRANITKLRDQAQPAQAAGNGYESSPQAPVSGYSSAPQQADKNSITALNAKIAEMEAEITLCTSKIEDHDRGARQGRFDLNATEARSAQLSKEIRKLEEKIAQRQSQLVGFSYPQNLEQLKNTLKDQRAKREPQSLKLSKLDGEIKRHESKKLSLESKARKYQSLYDQSLPLSKPFSSITDLGNLNSQLNENKQKSREAKGRRNQIENDIAKNESSIEHNHSTRAVMQKRQQELESNYFLIAFRDKPAELLSKMFDSLRHTLQKFDEAHPSGLSEKVRISLISLQGKANFILNSGSSKSTNDAIRKQYIQLSGLLYTTCEYLKGSTDREFADTIKSVLGTDVIDESEAKAAYSMLKSNNKEALRDLSSAELKQKEEAAYLANLDRMSNLLKDPPQGASSSVKAFYEKGNVLLASIQDERRLSDKSRGMIKFNFRLQNEILKTAAALLQNPGEARFHKRLTMLAGYQKNGQPSVAKKVLGAIAMFLGAAVAIVGGLMLSGLLPVVSLPVSGAMIAGGATLFAGGFALCIHGRKKGEAKALDKFEASATDAVNAESKSVVKAVRENGNSFFSSGDLEGFEQTPADLPRYM